MRKQFLLLMALCLAVGQSWAERIDVATAREVAEAVAAGGSTLRSAGELSLVYAAAPGQTGSALRSASAAGEADYFVFNVPGDGGFVIVAGDDRVRPVLGYSHEGAFDPDNLPENLRAVLASYGKEIAYAERNGIEASPAIAAEWHQYQSGTLLRAAGVPLLTTATWAQGDPYNRKTPMLATGEHAPAGCLATAAGILMKYHRYPTQALGGVTVYNGQEVTYSQYDWGAMPDALNASSTAAQVEAVSNLLWQLGANMKMEYGLESSAEMDDAITALRDVFGYSKQMQLLRKDNFEQSYSWADWAARLKEEIDNRRPVLYYAQTDNNPALTGGSRLVHAFVCDGYDSYDRFHFNWGWGGESNGYYVLTALDLERGDLWLGFNFSPAMVVNIMPNDESENRTELALSGPLATDGFKYNGSTSTYKGAIFPYDMVNKGNVPFDGYLAAVTTDRDGNIQKILYVTPLYRDPVGSQSGDSKDGAILIEGLLETDYVAVAYSTNNSTDVNNWTLIKGETEEIAYMLSVKTGQPVSEYTQYYNWRLVYSECQLLVERDGEWVVPDKLKAGPLDAKLVALPGYELPERVSLDMPGSYASVYYDSYTYDPETGELHINNIYGYLLISANCDLVNEDAYYAAKNADIKSFSYTINGETGSINSTHYSYSNSYNIMVPVNGERPTVSITVVPRQADATVDYPAVQYMDNMAVAKAIVTSPNGEEEEVYTVVFHYDGDAPEEPVTRHTITAGLLLDVTSDIPANGLFVGHGESATIHLTANEGFKLPEAITVMAGDTELTGYTYTPDTDRETATLTIPSVTADMEVSVDALEVFKFSIIQMLNLSSDIEDVNILEGTTDYTFTLTPAEGYELPATITITPSSIQYTYDSNTGRVVIEEVTSDWSITAVAEKAEQEGYYKVSLDLDGVVATPGVIDTQFPENSEDVSFGISFAAAEGYEYDGTITVMMGGVILSADKYTYANGTFTLNTPITGTLVITAKAEKKTYDVSVYPNESTIDLEEGAKATHGEPFSFKVTPPVGHTVSFSIRMGEDDYTDHSYDEATGLLTIENVTDDLSIEITATPEKYDVTLHLTDLATDFNPAEEKAEYGKPLDITLTPLSDNQLPETVTVTMNGQSAEFTYEDGVIHIEVVTGPVEITAAGQPTTDPDPTPGPDPTPTPTTYIVTLPVVEGATVEAVGSTSVEAGDSFSFTVTVKEGYVATNMVVKANGVTLTPNADGRYTIANVRSNVVVTVTGIEEDPATAIESVDASDLKVWAADGRLFIQTPEADRAYIVTFGGRVYKIQELPAGETAIPMPQGAYIIYVGGESFKISM